MVASEQLSSPRPDHVPARTLRIAKGHGTENDFVIVPDPDGQLELSPRTVAALCDRRAGVGGDGVLRVVRCRCLPEGRSLADRAEWFMDYRNADGSLAEMCGNGIRVFLRYLLRHGLADLPEGAVLDIGTRAGIKRMRREGELFSVDLGRWSLPGGAAALATGGDVRVLVHGRELPRPGLRVRVGNPHVVTRLDDLAQLSDALLDREPELDPLPAKGANVELVVRTDVPDVSDVPEGVGAPEGAGRISMRVHERGSGETRSCGTGVVAAALATRALAGPTAPRNWVVDVPGGRLEVRISGDDPLEGEGVLLVGPALLVADGFLEPSWWNSLAVAVR
ncbi:MAG: diaminopimelate epimerase [Actinomycetota bacterium]|nr:diaminopimelate epimerase [Actinomycetota bacterium]